MLMLYHGTNESTAKQALTEGLKPRSFTRAVGNWDSRIASHEDMVYLTSIYAGYFADCACEEDDLWAVIQVYVDDLNSVYFRPDEDFLGQFAFTQEGRAVWDKVDVHETASLLDVTQACKENIDRFSDVRWSRMSLEGLGTIAHRGLIPSARIHKIAVWHPTWNPLVAALFDPTISLLNRMLCSKKYENLTKWIMGEDYCVEDIVGPTRLIMSDQEYGEFFERLKTGRSEIVFDRGPV